MMMESPISLLGLEREGISSFDIDVSNLKEDGIQFGIYCFENILSFCCKGTCHCDLRLLDSPSLKSYIKKKLHDA